MKVSNAFLIFTIGVLADTYAGVLQSDQKPLHEIETNFEFHSNSEVKDITGNDELNDAPSPLSKWSDIQSQDMDDLDIEEFSEFLPIGLSYAGKDHKISEFDLVYEDGDATEVPTEGEVSTEPSAATLPAMVSSKLWIVYTMVLAIMSFRSF